MFNAVVRTIGGQVIHLDGLTEELKRSLTASVGSEARFVYDDGPGTIVVNLATVETIRITPAD